MTLPKDVAKRATELAAALEADSHRVATGQWGDVCKAASLCIRDLLTHLLSQDAEIDRLRAVVVRNAAITKSRLAAADALLRSIAAYAPPEHECVHGCTVTMCEACKLADYLRGPAP